MKKGDINVGKVIDKFVIYESLELVIENLKGERIVIHPDDENDWKIIVGDKVLVEKVSDYINTKNIKITRMK